MIRSWNPLGGVAIPNPWYISLCQRTPGSPMAAVRGYDPKAPPFLIPRADTGDAQEAQEVGRTGLSFGPARPPRGGRAEQIVPDNCRPCLGQDEASALSETQSRLRFELPEPVPYRGHLAGVFHQALADHPAEIIVCQSVLAKCLDFNGKIPNAPSQFTGELTGFTEQHPCRPLTLGNRSRVIRLAPDQLDYVLAGKAVALLDGLVRKRAPREDMH